MLEVLSLVFVVTLTLLHFLMTMIMIMIYDDGSGGGADAELRNLFKQILRTMLVIPGCINLGYSK